MRRIILSLALVASAAQPTLAQTMKDRVAQLFIFGGGSNPLFLGGTADPNNPAAIRAHGEHFVPSAVSQNGSIITFLTTAVGQSISSVPIGGSSSGETFRFEGGVPVKTSTSAGPILAERAQTLGRGRAIVGVGNTRLPFSTLRGQDLGNLELFFTHQNVNFPGCDSTFGGDCSKMGFPGLENETIHVRLNVSMDVSTTVFYATYGLLDNLDIGLVLPLVTTHFQGISEAQIIPFGGTTATHFFAGTPSAPVLSANRFVSGNSFGVGDVAVRAKALVRQTTKTSVALFGDARFATGDEADLLGAGYFSARGLAVLTGQFGQFAPHLNAGYLYRNSDATTDAVIATVGFDHLLASNVTLAVDMLNAFQVGQNKLRLPQPVTIDVPFQRVIQPTSIPELRDDIVDGSLGFKFTHSSGVTGIANVLVPLNVGGMRGRSAFTLGVEYAF